MAQSFHAAAAAHATTAAAAALAAAVTLPDKIKAAKAAAAASAAAAISKKNEAPDAVVLMLEPNRTIREVKERIEKREGHPTERIRIYANGVEHPDHKTLAECQISSRTDVRVELLAVSKVLKVEVHSPGEN